MKDSYTTTGTFTTVKRQVSAPKKRRRVTKPPYYRLLRNTAMCALLALGIWALASAEDAATVIPGGSEATQEASSSELLKDEDLGKLHLVGSDAQVTPMDGEVVTTFASSGKQVEIEAEPHTEVRSVLSGTVVKTDADLVVMQNDNGTRSTYTGVSPVVSAGEYVEQSGVIGSLCEEVLAVETVGGRGYLDSLEQSELNETMQ